MVESKIKCDVRGADVDHVTELKMLCKVELKEWHIPCICEGCRDAIDSALERRQHIMGCTVTPISPSLQKR